MTTETAKIRSLITTGKSTFHECKMTFKQGGLKAVVRRYGWKIFAFFFVYYLVRDLTIYVFIPYLIAKHFIT
jgi:hypothetical protein